MRYQEQVMDQLGSFANSSACKGDGAYAGLLTMMIKVLATIADELHEMNEHKKAEKVQEYKDLTDLFTDLIKEELNDKVD